MVLQDYYKFQPEKFNQEGLHIETREWFMDVLTEFERDFHHKHEHCYANYLFANSSTMILINKALDLGSHESCGMDLIDGEVNLDANLEIETFSEMDMVYAIGSKLEQNEDEPVFLVTDEQIGDGLILLKYIPDTESDDAEPQVPVNENVLTGMD